MHKLSSVTTKFWVGKNPPIPLCLPRRRCRRDVGVHWLRHRTVSSAMTGLYYVSGIVLLYIPHHRSQFWTCALKECTRPVTIHCQACVAAHVSAGSGWSVARARLSSPGRTRQTAVHLCCSGRGGSVQLFSPAKGVVGILHVALTPSWTQGLPRPPYQLLRLRVKAISPVGQSQTPSTHELGIGIRSKTGTHHSTCNIGVATPMLFVNKFINRLWEDGDVRSAKRPKPGSSGREISRGMQRSVQPCNPHAPSANFHVITQRQRKRSGNPIGNSTPGVGVVCMSHSLITHAPNRFEWVQGSSQAVLQYAMLATFARSRVMRTSPATGNKSGCNASSFQIIRDGVPMYSATAALVGAPGMPETPDSCTEEQLLCLTDSSSESEFADNSQWHPVSCNSGH